MIDEKACSNAGAPVPARTVFDVAYETNGMQKEALSLLRESCQKLFGTCESECASVEKENCCLEGLVNIIEKDAQEMLNTVRMILGRIGG